MCECILGVDLPRYKSGERCRAFTHAYMCCMYVCACYVCMCCVSEEAAGLMNHTFFFFAQFSDITMYALRHYI